MKNSVEDVFVDWKESWLKILFGRKGMKNSKRLIRGR